VTGLDDRGRGEPCISRTNGFLPGGGKELINVYHRAKELGVHVCGLKVKEFELSEPGKVILPDGVIEGRTLVMALGRLRPT
jgi:hypothetical protein